MRHDACISSVCPCVSINCRSYIRGRHRLHTTLITSRFGWFWWSWAGPKRKKNERTVGEPKRTQHHRHIYIIVGYIVIGKKKKRKKRKTFTNSNGGLMPCVMTLNVCRWGPTSSAHPFLSDSRLRITKIFFFAFYLCSSVQPTMELLSTSHRTGKEEKKNKNMIEMYFSDGNVYVFIHPECGNRIRRSWELHVLLMILLFHCQ